MGSGVKVLWKYGVLGGAEASSIRTHRIVRTENIGLPVGMFYCREDQPCRAYLILRHRLLCLSRVVVSYMLDIRIFPEFVKKKKKTSNLAQKFRCV